MMKIDLEVGHRKGKKDINGRHQEKVVCLEEGEGGSVWSEGEGEIYLKAHDRLVG